MRIAFFISSNGDTELAKDTIRSLEKKDHEVLLIPLTKAAQRCLINFESSALIDKKPLTEILGLDPDQFLEESCTAEQLAQLMQYIHNFDIEQSCCGVPSVLTNAIPFQIAKELDIPVLMAYEFMYKPEDHALWNYVPELRNKPKVQWALPLPAAKADFEIEDEKLHVIGHLSIDKAYLPKSLSSEVIRSSLQVTTEQSLAFISSTTQPVEVDAEFLSHVLAELPKHPTMQVRLGLHPGIEDLDAYLDRIVSIYESYPTNQFKIILPENLISRFKSSIVRDHTSLFLQVNINGSEASFAADRVAQAVPGALLNQAALEGKPAYSPSGKPYLPKDYFSQTLDSFFASPPKSARNKSELGLEEKTASECCAALF